MRQKVLKALANPPRIFYVPYNLAILNFLFWFFIFVILMIISIVLYGDIPPFLPLLFLGFLCLSHAIFGFYSRQDSQIAQTIISVIKIFKNRIPKRLVV